ncbi:MAG: DNA polymerase III subunit gamma/tau [Thermoguttaceae bacterium]
MPDPIDTLEHPPLPAPRSYVVVARRYRPQTFADLIGQEHVAQALSNAITTQRVGHAYLFTGARGVGKTSAARILAKSLNCVRGPAPIPCNECDICRSIGFGDDVDVLEIDGASNRGIDEIRQLRQNVNVRPSRARFKIYIIDEVHMLTREAFNALLKTLEEPPEHVKFIFCTTEPTKIPITILSRCQRFDFAGISSRSIAMRLRPSLRSTSRWPTFMACWAPPATSGWERLFGTWSSGTRPGPWPNWRRPSAKGSMPGC